MTSLFIRVTHKTAVSNKSPFHYKRMSQLNKYCAKPSSSIIFTKNGKMENVRSFVGDAFPEHCGIGLFSLSLKTLTCIYATHI